MGKTLVIVESPAKAKTIGKYLGSDYQVAASVGHVRDLPKSTLGVDINNDFKPRYITMPGKESVLRDLRKKTEKADKVLLATDPDREGEAIAWHLATALKIDPKENSRISFNEITKKAVTEALTQARPIDMDLVNAQQTRRILDRLVGYELSPLLWKKIFKGLSAGRVQSLATRMIVEREREIRAFVPEEYWLLTADLKTDKDEEFRSRFHGLWKEGKVSVKKLTNEAETKELIQEIEKAVWTVETVKKRKSKRASFPPFTTSSLQQEASRAYNYASSRTMRIAQQLYEGVNIPGYGQISLISYIRTDSLRISPDAAYAAREYIEKEYGKDYLPEKARFFKNKKAAQDAHEAIRPIHFDLSPDRIAGDLSPEQLRLYRLIWNKFMASQMTAAIFDTVTCDIVAAEDKLFRVKGETMIFPGWMRVYQTASEKTSDDDKDELDKESLPPLEEGQIVKLQKLLPEQKFTKPPARYTEASLIKYLEDEGVGRPSTYAPTISTILNRNYVLKEGRSLVPTELGEAVTVLLEENFENIVDVKFTAKMEEKLDEVESGSVSGVDILHDFYPPFHAQIEAADEKITEKILKDKKTGRTCPKCEEGELLIKTGRYGEFIACNRFPDCDYTETIDVIAEGKCPKCGSNILEKKSKKRGSIFYVCDKKIDPECDFISWDRPLEEKCELCDSYMVEKKYRGRKYKRCSNKECLNSLSSAQRKKKEAELAAASEKEE